MKRSSWLKLVVCLIVLLAALNSSDVKPRAKSLPESGYDFYVPRLLIAAESQCAILARGWEQARARIFDGLKRTLGEDLPRDWPPLNPTNEGKVRRQGYVIEQVSAEFWPGVRYAMEVFVPAGRGLFPAVVMTPTGAATGQFGQVGPRDPLYQQLGGAFARLGFLVVGAVPIGKNYPNVAYPYNGIALLAGTSIAQEQFHTGRRLLDYLLSRKDVDVNRVGMIGDSDGGWTTLYTSTFDSRIKAAAPGATNYTFCGLLLPQLWRTFDEAEGNAPEVLTYGANIPILTACNAPKWFYFINNALEHQRLQYIPVIDGAAKAAYEHAGVPERYSSGLFPCGHGIWPVAQVGALSWFSRVFLGHEPPPGALALTPVNAGQEKPPRKSFERLAVFGKEIELVWPGEAGWDELRVGILPDDPGKEGFLRIIETRRNDARAHRKKFAAAPEGIASELARSLGIQNLTMDPKAGREGGFTALETEPGLRVFGHWVREAASKSEAIELVVGTTEDRERARKTVAARFDLLLREEATLGPDTWALVMLNRPPVGMWAWDAMSAARWLKGEGFRTVQLRGVGNTGAVVAVFAAALSRDIDAIHVEGNTIQSLDEDVVGKQAAQTRYWAHRLLWVTDLPELKTLLQQQGRWK